MTGFILRRLAQLVPVLLLASLGIWAMVYAVPGSPIGAIVGENATSEQICAAIQRLGLDRPILAQYWIWLKGAIIWDFGLSIQSREPVLSLITARIPATLQLGLSATLVGLFLGVPIAIMSALGPGGWIDGILSGWNALALGVPTFSLGILLILPFAVELHVLPSASTYVPIWVDPWQAAKNLVLPSVTFGIYVSGIISRFLCAALLGELRADYVRTARAKGLRERDIVAGHVLRNALLPFVSIVGLMTATFIGGTVVTEAVFIYPGMGRLFIQAIGTRDYPLFQGCILFILLICVLMNVLVDVPYAYIDTRIEYG